jgi:hypothetical protein
MNYKNIFTSITRISDLQDNPFDVIPVPMTDWSTGDYIAAIITDPGAGAKIELQNGRMVEPLVDDTLIGALGVRHATLEATGTWRMVDPDGKMHLLTGAGLMGKMTSMSVFSPTPVSVKYVGHIFRSGQKLTMQKFVKKVEAKEFRMPVVLLVGTSMSAGKTTTARIVTRILKSKNLRVLGAKLTGAGRFRDILAIKDAGADEILDFVDAGMPSTVGTNINYVESLNNLLSRMAAIDADVAVIEIGASPLEPYNGDLAIQRIIDQVKCKILCASDPYAVYGVMKSFNFIPDLVSGPATNTIAAVELVEKLCGVKALNLLKPENIPALNSLLEKKLGI